MEFTVNDQSQSLMDLLGGFASNLHPKFLSFPHDVPPADVQDFLVDRILLNPHFSAYPVSVQNQSIFWKWIIKHLEEIFANASNPEDDELDSRIYEHYVSLIPTASSSQDVGIEPPSSSYITYFWKNSSHYEHSTLMESRKLIEEGTTGLTTWPASMYLADYLTSHSDLVKGKSILELGAGIGLLGMIMATLQVEGPSSGSICLTDARPDVLDRCQDNLSLPCNVSSSHSALSCHLLDWTDALDETTVQSLRETISEMNPELVVGADIVYDPVIIPALITTLYVALKGRTTVALLALTIRNAATIATFLTTARKQLTVEEVEWSSKQSMFAGTSGSYAIHEVKIFRVACSPRAMK